MFGPCSTTRTSRGRRSRGSTTPPTSTRSAQAVLGTWPSRKASLGARRSPTRWPGSGPGISPPVGWRSRQASSCIRCLARTTRRTPRGRVLHLQLPGRRGPDPARRGRGGARAGPGPGRASGRRHLRPRSRRASLRAVRHCRRLLGEVPTTARVRYVVAQRVGQYFGHLGGLGRYLDEFQPSLVQFQAGVDVHETDPLGSIVGMTTRRLRQRDDLALRTIVERGVPVVVNLAGGYQEHEVVVGLHLETIRAAAQVGTLLNVGQRGFSGGSGLRRNFPGRKIGPGRRVPTMTRLTRPKKLGEVLLPRSEDGAAHGRGAVGR